MDVRPTIDALVAALQLKEVQLIRQAMRAADQQGRGSPLGPAPDPVARNRVHPTPRFEPRPVVHPTPRFQPRPVIHPEPRAETKRIVCDGNASGQEVVVRKVEAESPLAPPWKSHPWENPSQPAPKVKLLRYHPDMPRKGALLDFFL